MTKLAQTRGLHAFETAALIRDLGRCLSAMMKCVLVALRINGEQSAMDICKFLGFRRSNYSSVRRALSYLCAKQIVRARRRKNSRYIYYKLAATSAFDDRA